MMGELTPWRFSRSLDALRRDMDELFERFFGNWGREFFPGARLIEGHFLPLESYVDGNTLIVKADLPGMDPKDVEVAVEGNQLTIKGERKATQEAKEDAYLSREVRYGSFARTIALPEGVKADEVHASYRNGVLEISMPAPPSVAVKKVPVEIHGEERKQIAA